LLFNYIAEKVGVPVSGIQMSIQNNLTVDITVSGKEFDKTRNYKILTSDFLSKGGDNMIMFS
jgi:2',3'-cyclic-nucleotide 2'-phosphodiesterase (5'-nucleotidase family)